MKDFSACSQSPLLLGNYANMHVYKKKINDLREFYQNMCRWFLKDKIKILNSFCSNLIKIRAFLLNLNLNVCVTLPVLRDWVHGHWTISETIGRCGLCPPPPPFVIVEAELPELISSEFSEASSFIQTWSLTSWEFIKPVLQKTLSCQPLSIKDNTDLEFVWKLQAFKKASSLKDLWIHALLRSRQIAQLQLRQRMGGGTPPPTSSNSFWRYKYDLPLVSLWRVDPPPSYLGFHGTYPLRLPSALVPWLSGFLLFYPKHRKKLTTTYGTH